MDTESILRESRAEALLKPLDFGTETGKTQFKKQLRFFTSNVGLLQRRQDTILALRSTLKPDTIDKYDSLFAEIQEIEPILSTFFEKTEVEKNSYEQLLFSGWKSLQILNTIPFALFCLSIFKQYIVPALAVLTPLFMIVMPYIFLKYWYNLPITTKQYTQIVLGMFGFQNLDKKNPRVLFQGALTVFSIGQSIYQPIQNALHLQTVHGELMKKAVAAQRFVLLANQLFEELKDIVKFKNPLQDIEQQDIHRLFATFWDEPSKLRLALHYIGDCEVVYRLAKTMSLAPVQLLKGTSPSLTIKEGIDPFLSSCIPFTLQLHDPKQHSILTGPNRGGKSSVLRSTLLTVVLAQTFGFGYCTSTGAIRLRPFDWIATGLRLEDRPGSTSMFESEVEFAVQILQRSEMQKEKLGFVLFDELFHSTNPPDGARTADIFLQQLWKKTNTASFISTHVFELAKKAPPTIQRLCVPAKKRPDGSLQFTYTLKKGICEVSSVDDILKEKGLLCGNLDSGKPETEGGNERVE
jgi:hypothetical protein